MSSDWSTLIWIGGLPDHVESTTLQGDTLINGMLYQKVNVSGMAHGGDYFIREDSLQRVYARRSDPGSTDQLIYHFGLPQGASVTTEPLWAFGNEFLYVAAVDTVQIHNGDFRRRMRMETINGANWMEYWIEGVGSNRGLLNASSFVWDFEGQVLCQHVGSSLEFTGDLYSTYGCTPTITGQAGPTLDKWDLNWSRASASEQIHIAVDAPSGSDYQLQIWNLQGQLAHDFGPGSGPSQWQAPAHTLATGLYLLRLEAGPYSLTRRMVVH